MSKTTKILKQVRAERVRQRQLLCAGEITVNVSSAKEQDLRKLPILAEEFGAVAKEICEMSELSFFDRPARSEARARMKVELIQLAAVAVAWAEALAGEA